MPYISEIVDGGPCKSRKTIVAVHSCCDVVISNDVDVMDVKRYERSIVTVTVV